MSARIDELCASIGVRMEKCNKREPDVFVLVEEMAAVGNNDEHIRATIKRSLKQLRKINEEEEAAKDLLEAVQERKQ